MFMDACRVWLQQRVNGQQIRSDQGSVETFILVITERFDCQSAKDARNRMMGCVYVDFQNITAL